MIDDISYLLILQLTNLRRLMALNLIILDMIQS